ncbi:MAG: VWA domain-containing protein, partial [Halobacteria archaeon]|nr:VWA domain-containing protein [Halobacteria archaeon]
MKYPKSESGQLIIVAGFLIAIAVVAVGVTLGGAFFSQSAPDESSSGVNSFSSGVTQQTSTARLGTLDTFGFSIQTSIRRGMNTSQMNKFLKNQISNYSRLNLKVIQRKATVNVTLNNTTVVQSWAAGQTRATAFPGINLTRVTTYNDTINVSDPGSEVIGLREPFDVVFTLDTTGSMASPAASALKPENGYYEDPTNSSICASESDPNIQDCRKKYVHGDDSNNEVKYEVDVNDTVYNTNNGMVGDVVGQNPSKWKINYHSGGTKMVENFSSSASVEVDDYVKDLRNGKVGIVVDQSCSLFSCYDYWNISYNSGGSDWVSGGNLSVSILQDRDVRYRYIYDNVTKMGAAKEATKAAIDALNGSALGTIDRGDRAGIVEFNTNLNDGARTVTPLTSVNGSKSKLKQDVDSLNADGGTNIAAGLEEALNVSGIITNDIPADADHIVLLSDG